MIEKLSSLDGCFSLQFLLVLPQAESSHSFPPLLASGAGFQGLSGNKNKM